MSQPVQVRIIPYGSGEYKQEVALRDEVLRRPIGRSIYTEDLSAEEHVQHVGAFMNGKLVGTMYLKSLDAQTCQIKQVAVKESYRGHNIGRKNDVLYSGTGALSRGKQAGAGLPSHCRWLL